MMKVSGGAVRDEGRCSRRAASHTTAFHQCPIQRLRAPDGGTVRSKDTWKDLGDALALFALKLDFAPTRLAN
jgi:hypothetical protein